MQAMMDMGGGRREPEDDECTAGLLTLSDMTPDARMSGRPTVDREIVHQILYGARPVTVDQSYIDQLHAA